MKIYQDRTWLYEHYVKKRMNMIQITELLDKKHGIQITPQALYNHLKKNDLLKYRGKGKKQGAGVRKKGAVRKRPKNPKAEMLKRRAQARKKGRR